MEQNNKFRSRFLTGVLIVLAVVVLAAAAVIISSGVKQNKYNSTIKKANHYFAAGEYQSAILEYENAITMDKKDESAYLKLTSVYMTLEDYMNALAVIERGLVWSDSPQLEQKLIEIQYLITDKKETVAEEQPMTEEEIQNYSKETTLENNIFDMVASYTYTEYHRDYGNVSGVGDGNRVTIDYVNGEFKTIYHNAEGEKIIDQTTNMPYGNVKPTEVMVNNLYKIFSSSSERFVVSYTKLQELFGESLQFLRDESGMYYVTAEYKKCRISIETDQNGNIISETAWNKIEPLNRSKLEFDEEVEGEVKGYIQDAVTGKGMKADMKVRERGKKNGTIIDEITSNKDGSYTFGGKQGKYTIEVSAKGYITEYIDVEVFKDQIKTGNNIVLSPEVGEGEIRIVLTWGSTPRDLDSYAVGKSSAGSNFKINFTNKNVSGVGSLDVDDTSGYGPETITITDMGANFEYYVFNYHNDLSVGGCGATVKLYLPGKTSAIEYKVPAGDGTLWRVFEYNNGEITKINKVVYPSSTNSVNK